MLVRFPCAGVAFASVMLVMPAAFVAGQAPAPADLDSLVARALAVSPTVHAATARLDATRALVAPAGARPDPMLMAGVQNFPVSRPGFGDVMTMKMLGVSQTIPYPGKLALRTRIAEREADAAAVAADAARREIVRQVKDAYFDIALADRALTVVARNQQAIGDLVRVTEAHSAVGTGTQADVLRARFETTELASQANALAENRRSALARLNALLERPSDAPIGAVAFPTALLRLAAPDSGAAIHFASAALGARVADDPLPPLDSLQARAEGESPAIRQHEAMIAAQRERVALARKAHLPDVGVSVEYGQRSQFGDMATAVISVPLPIQRRDKQDAELAAAEAQLAVLMSERQAQVNALNAEIAAHYSDAERARSQLALDVAAMLPQARATLASTTASFQVGRADFRQVIEAQAMTFNAETSYWRALADFGKALAALEQLVGAEVVR